MSKRFAVARGEHVGAVEPGASFQPSVEFSWDEFVEQVTKFEVRAEKDGPYFCRPMGGDGHRSDKNAGAWPLMPCDLDELRPEDEKALHDWAENAGLSLVLATTFSHSPDAPRMRIWVQCSRDVTPVEHPYLLEAFAPGFPFKLDRATAKPSQPIFLPACPAHRQSYAWAKEYAGKPADVDRILKGYQSVIAQRTADRAAGAKGIKTGVRVAGGTIDLFNKNFDLRELLDSHPNSYKRVSHNRYMYRGSRSGRAAVVLYTEAPEHTLVSFHETDPLSVRNPDSTIRVLDAFAAYAILEHNDSFGNAFEGARRWVNERGLGAEGAENKAPPKPLRLLKPTQIAANLQARDSVIQGMLECGCITVVTGDSNSGKTTVLQFQAMCVASGKPFAGRATKRSKVLWVAGEDAYNAQIRFLGLQQKYPADFDLRDLDDWLYVLPQRIEIMNPASLQLFHEALAEIPNGHDIGAIYLDSKSMVWGGEDENSNDEAARFIQVTGEQIAQRYSAAVVITHHLTKFKDKEQQSARGAGALINNVDHEWRFDKRGNANVVTLMPGTKLRIAPWGEMHFGLEILTLDPKEYSHLIDNFGEPPRISVPELMNPAGVNKERLLDDLEKAILCRLLDQGVARSSKKGKLEKTDLAREVLAHPEAGDLRAEYLNPSKDKSGLVGDALQKKLIDKYRSRIDRTVLPSMITDKLIDQDFNCLEPGRQFAKDTLIPCPVDPAPEQADSDEPAPDSDDSN